MTGEWREEKEGEVRRSREGRGLSGNVAEEAFCLKSAPDHSLVRIDARIFTHKQRNRQD